MITPFQHCASWQAIHAACNPCLFDSKSSASQTTATDDARLLSGKGARYTESGSLQIGDKSRVAESGSIQLGDKATFGGTVGAITAEKGSNVSVGLSEGTVKDISTAALSAVQSSSAQLATALSDAQKQVGTLAAGVQTGGDTTRQSVTDKSLLWLALAGVGLFAVFVFKK